METYVVEWGNLILRMLHVIAGITWVGTSFHFMWLDHSFAFSTEEGKQGHEVGHVRLVHSGAFYEVTKFPALPHSMLDNLHWIKWEAYLTWLSGMALLSLIYYIGAEYALVDRQVADLTPWQGIGIGLGLLVGSWLLYDWLCKTQLPKGHYGWAVLSLIAVLIAAFTLTRIFSAQGAFIHVGAMIGTIMAGNVFMVIIPAQKSLVAAITNGQTPDSNLAVKAKLRSLHNNYATLPLLFLMLSNHYPMVYMHEFNWLLLTAIVAVTAAIQHFFNLRQKARQKFEK